MKTAYYKYRPLHLFETSGSRQPHPFTKSIFEKAEIFYSAPKDFNDPFDCNLRLHTDGSTDAQWEAYFDKLIPSALNASEIATIQQAKAGKWWVTKPEIKANLGLEQHRIHYEESSVFCLSKKANSIPMFSYYADCHRGIAIEFSFSDTEIPCGISFGDPSHPDTWYDRKVVFRDVEYPPTYPELNYHKVYGTDQLLRSLLFTKHHEWAHEQEFRILRRKIPASAVQFDKRIVTRVIFGCRTSIADVALVKSWLVGWPSDVVLSKAETSANQFNLNVKDFDIVKVI